MTEPVYISRDNVASKVFHEDKLDGNGAQSIDFTAATRMTLELIGKSFTVDSDTHAGAIDWSAGNGKVDFKLGALGIAPGKCRARLVVFDPSHTNGQVLAHEESGPLLEFDFQEA